MAERVRVSSICCTYSFTLCISREGNVYSFGTHEAAHGQQEGWVEVPTIIPTLKNIQAVRCLSDHTVCLDYDGEVFTMGCNRFGQLGIGKAKNILEFTKIPQKLNLPPIQQISCGYHHTVCLTECGELYSFGRNQYGQLGQGNKQKINFPMKIQSLNNVDFVECGGFHTICKTFSNEIFSWGWNAMGQLGIKNFEDQEFPTKCLHWPENIVDIKCGYTHTLVLTLNQEVYSCGDNDSGQLGRTTEKEVSAELKIIPNLSNIIRIECGESHSKCIDISKDLFVFGNNSFGQLGLGHDKNQLTPLRNPFLSNIVDISPGGMHSLVKMENEILGFGWNHAYRIGLQSDEEEFQYTPVKVLIDKEFIWGSNNAPKKSARK